MKVEVFHKLLDRVCAQLTLEAKTVGFSKALIFENRVREVTQQIANELDADPAAQMCTGFPEEFPLSLLVDMNPPAQGFPDIVLGNVGIEVKFTEADLCHIAPSHTNKIRSSGYALASSSRNTFMQSVLQYGRTRKKPSPFFGSTAP